MLQFVLNKFELLYVIRLRRLPCLRRMNANYAVDIALEAIVLCLDGYFVRSIFLSTGSAIRHQDDGSNLSVTRYRKGLSLPRGESLHTQVR